MGSRGEKIGDHIMSSPYGRVSRIAVRARSLADAVNDIADGKVDGFMGPQGRLQGLPAAHLLPNIAIRPREPVGLMRTSWAVGLAVENTGESNLRDAVVQAVGTLKANGSPQKILVAHGVDYREAAVAATPESKS